MRTQMTLGLIGLAGVLAALAAGCDTPSAVGQQQVAELRAGLLDQPAPDFALVDHQRREVSLGGLRGQWVVLYFYPLDDMPNCGSCKPTEFTTMLGEFRQIGAKVYGVSDTGPPNLKVFVDTYKPGIDLLGDRDHRVSARYAAWIASGEKGQVVRTACIIDPQGRVRYHAEVTVKGRAKAVEQALTALRAQSAQPAAGGTP